MKKPRSITIIGRKWFDRVNGNTYHSAQVLVDGATVHRTDRAYGYGDQYEQSGFEWLEANGYLPGREKYLNGLQEAPFRYCERVGITYERMAFDTLKREL